MSTVDDYTEDDLAIAESMMEAMQYDRAKINSVMSFLAISLKLKNYDAINLMLGHIGGEFLAIKNVLQ